VLHAQSEHGFFLQDVLVMLPVQLALVRLQIIVLHVPQANIFTVTALVQIHAISLSLLLQME